MFTALVLAATLAAQPAEPKSAIPAFAADAVKPDPADTPLRKLQKDRARERAAAADRLQAVIAVGRWEATTLDDYVKVRLALAENLAELLDKAEDRVKCYEMRVEALREMEKVVASLVENGREAPQKLNLARAARMDAEIDLLRLGGAAARPLPADADGLVKLSVQEIADLAATLEKKEAVEKIRAAALKLKDTTDKVNGLAISKEDRDKLEAKYKSDLQAATALLLRAAMANPDGFKVVEEVMKK